MIGYYPSERASSHSSSYSAPEPTKSDGSAGMHRATLRGYTVLGKRYYPQIRPIGWKEVGIASWYGAEFHGRKTSSGETYNMYAPGTAAHKTLPMNSIVLVTHRETGAQVKARINDRGPFVDGRIIDLSYTAGKALAIDKTGTAPVTIEVLEYDAHIAAQLNSGATRQANAAPPLKNAPKNDASNEVAPSGNFLIQLGSFRNLDGANRLKDETQKKTPSRAVVIQTVVFGSEKLHRVLIGGFDSKEDAARFKDSQGFTSAVIVSAS
ncbi:MAG: septal ring lytic transglycosylase RlpA family protein [Helicobacteraceae bacterium]|nr:septal ring lytic transglycosylase RlpA family protein [Helicobacteraceae bacterium]